VKDLEKIITSFGVQEELNPKIWDNPNDAPKSHMKLEIRKPT
jgi:ribosomal protein L31E